MMAQANLKFGSKAAKTTTPVSRGQAASGNRYQAAYQQSQKPTTAQPAWLQQANKNANERAAAARQAMPQTLSQTAQKMAGNMPQPAALKPLAIPSGKGTSLGSTVQQLANTYYDRLNNPIPYQTPQGTSILSNAQDLQGNFIPQTPQPQPLQPIGNNFNRYAPPTNTVLPDTYAGQIQRLIERATASGRTLPDTIQGMLDRLGQQYAPNGPGNLHATVQTMLPDTEEGALQRLIDQMTGLPTDTGGTGGGPGGDTGGGTPYPQQPSLADIMRWMYGSIYWRGW